MHSLIQDVRFALRQISRQKSFVAAAILTLALCLGANATIFSVVNSVILQPLPLSDPGRIVTMWNAYPGAGVGGDVRGGNGAPDFYDRRAMKDVFEEVAAFRFRGRSIEIDGVPRRIQTREVTPSLFPLIGADPALGRTFTEDEGEPGQGEVVVLGYGLWQELFGGEPSVLGRDLRVDGRARTIVGILPEGFVFLDEGVRLWTPLSFSPEQRQQYHNNNYNMVARLRDGVTIEQAQTQIDALNAANMDRFPELRALLIDAGFHTPLHFLQDDLVRDVRDNLYLLWGGVAFVLLIGCVNVANLLLVRTTGRVKEMATRSAVGATRGRLVRQLLTETVLFTVLGGILGLLVGQAGLVALDHLDVPGLPRGGQIRLDLTTVAFTGALTLVVGVLMALIPVASILRVRLSSVLSEEGRSSTAGRGTHALRKGLVSAQIALALVLLVGAGLLLASFRELLAIDPGFEPQGVLTGSVSLPDSRYPEDADLRAFARDCLEPLRALPGVEAAGLTSHIPFGFGFSDSVIFAEGYVMRPGESVISPTQQSVSPGYFEAMGMRILEGRPFDARDVESSRRVVIVDERLAQRFWPEGNAVGGRMWSPNSAEDINKPENATHYDVVGIVESIQMRSLTSQRDATGAYYFPLAQSPRRVVNLAIRTTGDTRALFGPVRRVIARLDPELPLYDIRTMPERIDSSLTERRTAMVLSVGFSAVALLLAAVGIYGVLAYMVQLRTREIGIRVALGSDPSGVLRLVFKDGLRLVVIGLGVGVAGALGMRRFIDGQLHGVSSLDPGVFGSVATLLAVVALVACAIPAHRATRIDVVRALTYD
ncbi:MAG: ABC transporter permease [Acidobacteriota bacterium]|jgi:predicted permease